MKSLIIVKKIKDLLDYGVGFTDQIGLKKEVQITNFFFMGVCNFLIFIASFNLISDDVSLSISGYVHLFIIILVHIIFRVVKNIKLYSFMLSTVLTIMLCETLVLGGHYGAGLIAVGVNIIAVMNISGLRNGSILAAFLILFEIFIMVFNDRFGWIYTYPEPYKEIYLRFLITHIGIFAFTYYSIKKQNDLYSMLNKEKDERKQLFLNIVHDLKTPLTIIHNNIDRGINENGSKESKELLKSNIRKMERNVLNILDINRIEKGYYQIDSDAVINVSKITTEICALFEEYIDNRNLSIKTVIEEDLHAGIDDTSYVEIVNNLLDNAIKYTGAGGTIKVILQKISGKVSLTVSDTGIGIPENEIDDVFNSYYQGNKGLGNYYGLGIGLSLTKKLCEAYSGEISLLSKINSGTSVTVLFPVYKVRRSLKTGLNKYYPFIRTQEKLYIKMFDEAKKSILVIEDNTEILNLLINSLSEDYNILTAGNGQEGLSKIYKYNNMDLIITDIMMPEMDGIEFVKQLRKKEKDLITPVVFLTAKSLEEDVKKCLSLGAIDFISKPFCIDELKLKINSILSVWENRQKYLISNITSKINNLIDNSAQFPSGNARISRLRDFGITKKEEEIIKDISNGLSNKEIASKHGIAFNTVRTHIYRIYRKCNVSNSVGLVKLFS